MGGVEIIATGGEHLLSVAGHRVRAQPDDRNVGSSRARLNPETPLAAVSTAKPSSVRYVAISSRAVGSSSITRTVRRLH
jgi:hypothetical protein